MEGTIWRLVDVHKSGLLTSDMRKMNKTLVDFLKAHESDIASGINDFGDLKPVFTGIFDREPEVLEKPKG